MGIHPENVVDDHIVVPWWVILLTGIVALILGLLLLASPGITTLAIVEFLGAFWLLIGVFSIVEIFLSSYAWGWKLFQGIVGILAGLTVLRNPITSAIFIPTLIVILIAIEGIIIGVVCLVRAIQQRSVGLGLLGVLCRLNWSVVPCFTVNGCCNLPILIGGLAVLGGVALIFESFRFHDRSTRTKQNGGKSAILLAAASGHRLQ